MNVEINGGGWTEFDHAYYKTYDNAYTGYFCTFKSEGRASFDSVASGEQGYHLIDFYPSIYKQKATEANNTLIPQLT
ncbi:hypothetical protein [Kurthia sibirica]|uniref:hypothetical protein n=1 Tax=Kurthia sibirica TaxID=202750 RepID=UPI00116BF4E6|nr:hypothetical protein [Kurthia sibirica]GEK33346.1 hypothetical protein KSI01_08790 [Kurthia sibirica]